MKAVILAAGIGSRLDNGSSPKALTPLANGKSILQMQLEAIVRFLTLDQIYLVVGYHKEELLDGFPDLLYVYNSHYDHENTSKSLLRAASKINDDLLWINGDVVFHFSILEQIINNQGNSSIVNRGPVGDEEVKYRTDASGHITHISKNVADAEGEALGINLFRKGDLPLLIEGLEQCSDSDYFEKAIEYVITKGVIVQALEVNRDLCVEVDFPEDLQAASAMIRRWKRGTSSRS